MNINELNQLIEKIGNEPCIIKEEYTVPACEVIQNHLESRSHHHKSLLLEYIQIYNQTIYLKDHKCATSVDLYSLRRYLSYLIIQEEHLVGDIDITLAILSWDYDNDYRL